MMVTFLNIRLKESVFVWCSKRPCCHESWSLNQNTHDSWITIYLMLKVSRMHWSVNHDSLDARAIYTAISGAQRITIYSTFNTAILPRIVSSDSWSTRCSTSHVAMNRDSFDVQSIHAAVRHGCRIPTRLMLKVSVLNNANHYNWIKIHIAQSINVPMNLDGRITIHMMLKSVCAAINQTRRVRYSEHPAAETWLAQRIMNHLMLKGAMNHDRQNPDSFIHSTFKVFALLRIELKASLLTQSSQRPR